MLTRTLKEASLAETFLMPVMRSAGEALRVTSWVGPVPAWVEKPAARMLAWRVAPWGAEKLAAATTLRRALALVVKRRVVSKSFW
jgi:hypothetical protein